MGFYIRKSISLGGGVRLNLSKGGLGISGGVKGFRVGMNGRGTYVHMGRGGLYYRKQFSYSKPHQQRPRPAHSSVQLSTDPTAIFTEDLVAPLDVKSGAADTKDVLQHFQKRTNGAIPLAWLLGGLALASVLFSAAWAVTLGALSALIFGISYLTQRKSALIYDLEDDALKHYEIFVNEFEEFCRSNKFWIYQTRSDTFDLKRNAGAGSLINRAPAVGTIATEKSIKSNISIPCLASADQKIFFLPDILVCIDKTMLAAFKYQEVMLDAQPSQFVEEDSVPTDTKILRHTWQYVNKNGDPDRRFNNNRKLPVCLYQDIVVAAQSYKRVFSKSRFVDFDPLAISFRGLRQVTVNIVEVTDVPQLTAVPALPAS